MQLAKTAGHSRANYRVFFLFCPLLVCFLPTTAVSTAVQAPTDWLGEWSLIGRTQFQSRSNSATIEGGYAVSNQKLNDAEISFRARTANRQRTFDRQRAESRSRQERSNRTQPVDELDRIFETATKL